MPASKAPSFYTSGFEIVHRYVYVLIPLKGDPVLVFPQEARWIGDKKKPFVKEKVWAEVPGRWLRERAQDEAWKRVAVYGLDYIMAVRDYRELQQGSFELVPFDFHFDMARAVKSEEELVEVRDSMDIIHEGFWALLNGFAAGKTEAEIMAPAVEVFFARGAGPRMMNIVLSGQNGEAEAHFKVPGHRKVGERRPAALLAGDRRRGRLLGGIFASAHPRESPASARGRWLTSIPRRWRLHAS